MCWHALDVERLIEEDHPARAIWELVGRLDLASFLAPIASVQGQAGRPAFDPHLLVSLWLYAYSRGIGSAREIARRCEYEPPFQWLTGLDVVNYHTLSDFRIEHRETLDELFSQVLAVLSAESLITLERVMHDGTKVYANAGQSSFCSKERIEKAPGDSTPACRGDGRTVRRCTRRASAKSSAACSPRSRAKINPRLKWVRKSMWRQAARLQPYEQTADLSEHFGSGGSHHEAFGIAMRTEL
jgi:transposase